MSLLRLHCIQLLGVAKRPLLQYYPKLEQKANPKLVFPSVQNPTGIVEAGRYVWELCLPSPNTDLVILEGPQTGFVD